MNQQIEIKGLFLNKSESVKTPDDKFMSIAKFLVDGKELSYTVITDGAWLNAPDTDKNLTFTGNLAVNANTNALEIISPSWKYFSTK